VIRKHTRRAVKAAFAVSIGVALLLGVTACGDGGGGTTAAAGGATDAAAAVDKAATPVNIGSKNFTEQYVLGQLYKQALEAKGYTVTYKENIGSSELIDTALTSGDINFYPEYLGIIVQVLAHQDSPDTEDGTYQAAKTFEESRGFTLLDRTPFSDSDSFGVLKTTADKYGLKTIDDLKKVKDVSYAGFPECRTRPTCLIGLKEQYGLTDIKFVPLASISVYTLLDQGKVFGGDTFSTDPQLATGKYVILDDTKHIFGFQNVAPIVSQDVVDKLGPEFTNTVNSVSALLTTEAMIAMNKAVAIDKQSPADVAQQFLAANGLT
jgi:osmoprotectant transport system substrate-binding protein